MRLWEGDIIREPAQAALRVKRFVYPDTDRNEQEAMTE